MADIYESLMKVREQEEEEAKRFQITMVVAATPSLDVDEYTIEDYIKGIIEEPGTELVVEDIHSREEFGE